IFSGGVAQNIKANMKLSAMDDVEDFFVCPAAGDTSLSIGACYVAMWDHLRGLGESVDCLAPLDSVYLGPSFTKAEVRHQLEEHRTSQTFEVSEGYGPAELAALIAEGKVLARCSGRMEFGLRALGNRSILADPSRPESLPKINQAIKFRDFWMPFTPSILAE